MYHVTEYGGEYVLQPNKISRAIYNLSVPARRIMALAMSALPGLVDRKANPLDFRVDFSIKEFYDCLGIKDTSGQRADLIAAVRECMNSSIEIKEPSENNPDVEIWHAYTWFIESYFEIEKPNGRYITHSKEDQAKIKKIHASDRIVMTFNPLLGEALREFKDAYAQINLSDLGKLSSAYAMRYFEIALSWRNTAKKRNRTTWSFKYTVEEIRTMLMIGESEYRRANNFRKFVIDYPIQTINEAGVGLRIEPEYIRKGGTARGKILEIKFNCRLTKRGERDATPATETEKETATLRQAHPEEWDQFRAAAAAAAPKELPGIMSPEKVEAELDAAADAMLSGHLAAQRLQEARPAGWPGHDVTNE
jgi:hypothetical protein